MSDLTAGLNATVRVLQVKGDEYTASQMQQASDCIADLERQLAEAQAELSKRLVLHVEGIDGDVLDHVKKLEAEIARMRPVVKAALEFYGLPASNQNLAQAVRDWIVRAHNEHLVQK